MNIKNNFDSKRHKEYKPKFPDKYQGKYPIIIRSSYEESFIEFLENNENVIAWGSEDIQIPYYDPVRNKNRRYFPDFIIKIKDIDNKNTIWMVEIKPHKETIPPIITKGKSKKTLLTENKTWKTNIAKWKAAQIYCKKRNWKFKIITEKHLYGR